MQAVGRVTHEIPEAARLCDLTVFAGPLFDYDRLFPNVVERMLLASGRALILVPQGAKGFPPEGLALAWDASVQAVRDVFAAEVFLLAFSSCEAMHALDFRRSCLEARRSMRPEIMAYHCC